MENPFKKSETRLPEYNTTQDRVKNLEQDKDRLEFPAGHSRPDDGFASTAINAVKNSIQSIPNLPKIELRKIQIKLAERKLEKIFDKDQAEAQKLSDKYDKLFAEAEVSGDGTKLKEFATKELGMEME